jgi:hypothetical protein
MVENQKEKKGGEKSWMSHLWLGETKVDLPYASHRVIATLPQS